jgi:hypothetical protein
VKYAIALIALLASLNVALAQDAPDKPAEPKPAEPKAAEPEPKTAKTFGDPLTMGLPDSVKEAIRDQGIAITRMSLEFDERGSKDGIALEFEGMRTEIPLVFAAFVGEKCDQALSYKDWLARAGHGVDVTFLVKTMPAKLDGLEVSIEHLHMKGSGETLQSSYKAADAEVGKPYSVRLRGAQPGINHYRLVVSYKNAAGERTSQTGFSHWLIVAAPPMFEFAAEPTCVANWHKAGKLTIINAEATLNSTFVLHTGLSMSDCEVRVMRRGTRDIHLENLSPEVRRVVGDSGQTAGWQEVGRAKTGDKEAGWLKFTLDENGFAKLSCTHSLSVTSDVLPLNEAWEYRFELRHKSMREALATWSMNVALKINKPEDIAKAKLTLTATGMEKALEVAITERK